jgi:hypothetical protein
MSERRANPRVKGPFDGYWDGAGRQAGRILDLSVTGCFIDSQTLPSIGQMVKVVITIEDAQLDLPAVVVYSEPQQGFAVHFGDLPEQVSNALAREIARRLEK